MAKWQLQDAKNRLSAMVRKATEEGPQVITLRGSDAVVTRHTDDLEHCGARCFNLRVGK